MIVQWPGQKSHRSEEGAFGEVPLSLAPPPEPRSRVCGQQSTQDTQQLSHESHVFRAGLATWALSLAPHPVLTGARPAPSHGAGATCYPVTHGQ